MLKNVVYFSRKNKIQGKCNYLQNASRIKKH